MEEPPQEFTRGEANAPDLRGKSMVEKHLEARRLELEATCMALLQKRYPHVGDATKRAVLEETNWDPDTACAKLAEFLTATGKSAGAAGARASDDSASSSSDGDDSGSSSGDDGGGKRGGADGDGDKKRKRHKSGSDKRERKSASKKKQDKKDKKEKKSKKHKKEKRSRKEADSDEERLARARSGKVDEAQFGRYGVLRESDLWEKRPEFIAWLTEVKGLNVEALAKWEEKEQFKLFIQDYNTATLPHRKYYDLQAHHLREAAKEAAAGGPPKAAEVDFSKMEDERKRELAGDRARKAEDDKKHLIQHMMLTGKLAGLREQEQLKTELQMAAAIGDNNRVKQIQKKLEPLDPFSKEALKAKEYGFRP